MAAIDFSELLRKEKRKAKKNSNTKSDGLGSASESAQPSPPTKPSSSCCLPLWKNTHDDAVLLDSLRHDLKLICSDPASIRYCQNVLTHSQLLQDWLIQLPHGDSGLEEWKTMTYGKRRVCMFGEEKSASSQTISIALLPPPLSIIADELVRQGLFPVDQPANHVLLNEYQPSQGILPHTDGPLYASRTATLSLGSDVVLEFTKRLTSEEIGNPAAGAAAEQGAQLEESPSQLPIQVLLHANSLIVFEEDAYLKYCHGIPMEVLEDTTSDQCVNSAPGQVVTRGRRFSLTFRHKLQGFR